MSTQAAFVSYQRILDEISARDRSCRRFDLLFLDMAVLEACHRRGFPVKISRIRQELGAEAFAPASILLSAKRLVACGAVDWTKGSEKKPLPPPFNRRVQRALDRGPKLDSYLELARVEMEHFGRCVESLRGATSTVSSGAGVPTLRVMDEARRVLRSMDDAVLAAAELSVSFEASVLLRSLAGLGEEAQVAVLRFLERDVGFHPLKPLVEKGILDNRGGYHFPGKSLPKAADRAVFAGGTQIKLWKHRLGEHFEGFWRGLQALALSGPASLEEVLGVASAATSEGTAAVADGSDGAVLPRAVTGEVGVDGLAERPAFRFEVVEDIEPEPEAIDPGGEDLLDPFGGEE